ncbi:reverse transcriptase [Gossypium australe]|uniref:Reverse transcriptase n=1 Tax=Gossypium australe TaxID=47621 RepID=A0A5B6W6I5_9ROSI|nr:reverse transcriptase [Gossypium australe]
MLVLWGDTRGCTPLGSVWLVYYAGKVLLQMLKSGFENDCSVNDFIESLPNSNRKNSILVVVDHLTKYGHFLALSHPYTAKEVAQEYLNNVYKLHGMPGSIISDRDRIFVSNFWQDLFRQAGTKLLLSTVYHPQTDGQTEWLPLAEWWYNSSFHSSIQLTPYEALYGQPPPTFMPYLAGASSVAIVDRSLQARRPPKSCCIFT